MAKWVNKLRGWELLPGALGMGGIAEGERRDLEGRDREARDRHAGQPGPKAAKKPKMDPVRVVLYSFYICYRVSVHLSVE